jgi:hypothetical protein
MEHRPGEGVRRRRDTHVNAHPHPVHSILFAGGYVRPALKSSVTEAHE